MQKKNVIIDYNESKVGALMRIGKIFSDGMVLQRGAKNSLWGKAKAGNRVTCRIASWQEEVTVNEDGTFRISLRSQPAGEAFNLFLEETDSISQQVIERIEIKDAVYGDVFLLGGQSNMELPVARTLDVTAGALGKDFPLIKQFRVPIDFEFAGPCDEMADGLPEEACWIPAVGGQQLNFSAAGFFMARELQEKYQVPIGLILTAVGGTPIEAWCSRETIYELGDFKKELEQCQMPGYVEGIQQMEQAREQQWHEAVEPGSGDEGPALETGSQQIPGLWEGTPWEDFCGSLELEKEIFLEEDPQDIAMPHQARIYLGAIVDADRVYVNDYLVGATEYCYPPRKYDFPIEYLKKGSNKIRIWMKVFRKNGGFIPDKPYELTCGRVKYILAGQWSYKILKRMPVLEETTFFQYKPAGVYNRMICPIAGYGVKGVAFYQGESNTHYPGIYKKYFIKAMSDWRRQWAGQQLPVVFVQLANFADSKRNHVGEDWAKLRQQQRECLELEASAMVVTIDIGEYNDLHPQDKLTLGKRLARAMEGLVYGEKVVYSGPDCIRCTKEGGRLELHFAFAEGGLYIKGQHTKGFEIAGADKVFFEAQAIAAADDTIRVWNDKVTKPVYCRYAWGNNPEKANVYNREGLPAVPFSIKAEI